jgi:hypothetical protein
MDYVYNKECGLCCNIARAVGLDSRDLKATIGADIFYAVEPTAVGNSIIAKDVIVKDGSIYSISLEMHNNANDTTRYYSIVRHTKLTNAISGNFDNTDKVIYLDMANSVDSKANALAALLMILDIEHELCVNENVTYMNA